MELMDAILSGVQAVSDCRAWAVPVMLVGVSAWAAAVLLRTLRAIQGEIDER